MEVFRNTWWALGQIYYELGALGFRVNLLWFVCLLPYLGYMVFFVLNPLLVAAGASIGATIGGRIPVEQIPSLSFLFAVVGTLVTAAIAGPATAALTEAAHEFIEGESVGARTFVRGFRRNFFRGWLFLVVDLYVLYGLIIGFVFYTGTGQLPLQALGILSLYLVFLWAAAQAYFWPLGFRYRLAIHHTVRNATVMALSAFVPSLMYVLVALVTTFLSVLMLIPLMFLSGATLAMVGHRMTEDRLRAFGVDPSTGE